jgi:hypothetical protein
MEQKIKKEGKKSREIKKKKRKNANFVKDTGLNGIYREEYEATS